MTITNGQLANADEVRPSVYSSIANIFDKLNNDKSNVGNPNGTTAEDFIIPASEDQNFIATRNANLKPRQEKFYQTTAGTYSLTSRSIPLISTNSKVLITPIYNVYSLYDECDNSSIDGTKWVKVSGDNATEDTKSLQVGSGGGNATIYRTADLSSYSFINLDYSMSGTATIRFYDGTASVEIGDNVINTRPSSTSGDNNRGTLNIRLDWVNKRAYVKHVGIYFDGTNSKPFADNYCVNLSTLSTNIYLEFNVDSSSYINIYGLRTGKAGASTTIVTEYTRDGGTNWTSTSGGIGTSTSAGTTLKVRFTGTVASNEVIILRGWSIREEII